MFHRITLTPMDPPQLAPMVMRAANFFPAFSHVRVRTKTPSGESQSGSPEARRGTAAVWAPRYLHPCWSSLGPIGWLARVPAHASGSPWATRAFLVEQVQGTGAGLWGGAPPADAGAVHELDDES